MSKDLSAYIAYGAREDDLMFLEDNIKDMEIYDYVEDSLSPLGISRIIGFDSQDDCFIGFVLEYTSDWESKTLDLTKLSLKLEEAKVAWNDILLNPEVLQIELIPSYI